MAALFVLKRGEGLREDLETGIVLDDDQPFGGIRCPLCRWQPSASSLWSCEPAQTPEPSFVGCGTIWNTFLTRGRCPGCAHQWRWTSCLRCEGWSLHEDWYEENW